MDELWQLRVLLFMHVFRSAETPVKSCEVARASVPMEARENDMVNQLTIEDGTVQRIH